MFDSNHPNNKTIHCDSNFNPINKVHLESLLSKIVIEQYASIFSPVVAKIFKLIEPDLMNVLTKPIYTDTLESELFLHLSNDFHIAQIIPEANKMNFSNLLLSKLQENTPQVIYLQMILLRLYLTFFISKGNAKPVFYKAVESNWSNLNLQALLADVIRLRGQHFKNNIRVNKKGADFIRSSYGIFAKNDTQSKASALFKHDCGSWRYRITSSGDFTKKTMFKYNMPALCGPSGMVALYLALANQAQVLTYEEKTRFNFFVCFFTIYVGGHSLDECFSIGRGQFNQYRRGNYYSILKGIVLDQALTDDIFKEIDKYIHNGINNRLTTSI